MYNFANEKIDFFFWVSDASRDSRRPLAYIIVSSVDNPSSDPIRACNYQSQLELEILILWFRIRLGVSISFIWATWTRNVSYSSTGYRTTAICSFHFGTVRRGLEWKSFSASAWPSQVICVVLHYYCALRSQPASRQPLRFPSARNYSSLTVRVADDLSPFIWILFICKKWICLGPRLRMRMSSGKTFVQTLSHSECCHLINLLNADIFSSDICVQWKIC